MTLTYDTRSQIKDLELVLDEYTGWFMLVVRRLFYPAPEGGQIFKRPESFASWIIAAEENAVVEEGTLATLKALHNDLMKLAETLINDGLKFQQAPHYEDFDKLATFFEEFLNFIRRIAKDHAVGEGGVDALTGLRKAEMFFKDTRSEMDRLARQGKSFSLVTSRIDFYDRLETCWNAQQKDECLRFLANILKKCLRSFDDAYRMENGEFVLSLKQTSAHGGMKALNRVKRALDETPRIYEVNGEKIKLTLSSCIGEPMPEDDIRQFMVNMKRDLDSQAGKPETIIEYFEMSPLQRFIKEGRE